MEIRIRFLLFLFLNDTPWNGLELFFGIVKM